MKNLICLVFISLAIGTGQAHSQSGALLFNGVDNYVDISAYINMSPTDAVTIEAWIKGPSTSSIMFIYDRVEQNDGYGLSITSTGNARLTINGGIATATSSSIVMDGTWHHIAGTYDKNSGKLYIYVDGLSEGDNNYSSAITYSPEPRNGIGGPGASSSFFTGSIDEVRIWSYARTASEIQNNMCATLDPANNTALVAYWQLDDGIGLIATDLTANGNDGNLLNDPTWISDTSCTQTGVSEHLENFNLKLYPNPFTYYTTLNFENPDNKPHTLNLYDVQGRLIRTIPNISSDEVLLTRGNLSEGLYFFELRSEGEIRGSGKLVIE